jgi:hypothetical protein
VYVPPRDLILHRIKHSLAAALLESHLGDVFHYPWQLLLTHLQLHGHHLLGSDPLQFRLPRRAVFRASLLDLRQRRAFASERFQLL